MRGKTAGIVILVLFSLLVALTAILMRYREDLAEWAKAIAAPESTVEISVAEERLRRSEELERAVSKLKDWQTEVQSMFEALAEAGLDPTSLAGREKLETTIKALEVLKADDKDPTTVLAEFAQLHDEVGRMRGELDYYKRLYGHPPCWRDEEDKIDYTFEVKLTKGGYVLRAIDKPRHRDHPMMPVVARVTTGQEVPVAVFLKQTTTLFEWSVENDCRFFVIVYDGTGDQDKLIFQRHMDKLEDHFYKWYRIGVAPPF